MGEIPNALMMSGDNVLFLGRELDKIRSQLIPLGYSYQEFDMAVPEDHSRLRDTLHVTDVFFSDAGKTLAIVTNPTKGPLELFQSHVRDTSSECVIVFLHHGRIDKRSKFYKAMSANIPSKYQTEIMLPPPYKAGEFALEFLKGEIRNAGLKADDTILAALVKRAGTDLGVLVFETKKLSWLAGYKGVDEITAEDFKSVTSSLNSVDVDDLISALLSLSKKKVARSLYRIRESFPGDPTMMVCGKMTYVLFRWVKAIASHGRGVDPEVAAKNFNTHPWFWKNTVLPQATRLGESRIKGLVDAVAQAQTATLIGAVNPWGVLEAKVLACI